jgi:hypothetical protein
LCFKEKQEAERKRVEAQGIADYQRIISTGLSDKQLQYEQIKAQKELAASTNTRLFYEWWPKHTYNSFG